MLLGFLYAAACQFFPKDQGDKGSDKTTGLPEQFSYDVKSKTNRRVHHQTKKSGKARPHSYMKAA